MSQAELSPDHFAQFLIEFCNARIPVLGVNFQGYEVTLPQSWPYVEAVFAAAKARDVERSLITNGMLIHKWADRIRELDVSRVTVSLDGSSASANDPLRGFSGAFDATTKSVKWTTARDPEFGARLAVASTIHSEANFRSLRKMPQLLKRMGVPRWVLGFAVRLVEETAQPVLPTSTLAVWLHDLQTLGEAAGIPTHINDELGVLSGEATESPATKSVFDCDYLYRLDPLGHVRSGRRLLEVWDERFAPKWIPGQSTAPVVAGYRKTS